MLPILRPVHLSWGAGLSLACMWQSPIPLKGQLILRLAPMVLGAVRIPRSQVELVALCPKSVGEGVLSVPPQGRVLARC